MVSISPQKLYTVDEMPVSVERRLTAYVDILENEKKKFETYRGSNPGPSIPQHSVYTPYAITDPKILTTDMQLHIA